MMRREDRPVEFLALIDAFEQVSRADRIISISEQSEHECPHCGLSLDADHNAARNILERSPMNFLRLEANKTYRIRLVGRAFEYRQHYTPVCCRSPGPDTDPLYEMAQMPVKRYAIWVLDRNENNQLSIMDFSPSLYDQFIGWEDMSLDDSGGDNGPDWSIIVDSSAPPPPRRPFIRYRTVFLERTPFTDEERQMLIAGVPIGRANMTLMEALAEVRRAHTADEIRGMLAVAESFQPYSPPMTPKPDWPTIPKELNLGRRYI
jgi:hypothetical protein